MQFRLKKGPTFEALCDASAVVPLDTTRFFAASDETASDGHNRLAVYDFAHVAPVAHLDLHPYLRGDGTLNSMHDAAHPETDIEGATRIGDTIFWVASHGRNARGLFRPSRHRFFAIEHKNGAWTPFGTPYTALLSDLKRAFPAIADAENQSGAPESGGVSIEGLCEGRDGELWLGFRSPRLEKRALSVPLLNPFEVLRGQPARLGAAFTLDLGGRGIRDWLKLDAQNWLIVAGASRSRGTFALYRWNGNPTSPPRELGEIEGAAAHAGLDDFAPEGLLHMPNGDFYLVSDDGDRSVKGRQNKFLPTPKRTFRTARLFLDL